MEEDIDPKFWQGIMAAKDSADSVRYQLEADTILNQLRLDLLGKEIGQDGQEIMSQNKKPKMNVYGVADLMSFLSPRISRVTTLSNIDGDEIKNRCLSFTDALTFLLCRHIEDYNIGSLQVLNNIIELSDDLYYVTMRKAAGAGERDTIRKNYQDQQVIQKIIDRSKPSSPLLFGGNREGG